MADEENMTAEQASDAPVAAEGVETETAAPAAEAQAPELTLTEKVAADEAGDAAKFAELKEKIEALGGKAEVI